MSKFAWQMAHSLQMEPARTKHCWPQNWRLLLRRQPSQPHQKFSVQSMKTCWRTMRRWEQQHLAGRALWKQRKRKQRRRRYLAWKGRLFNFEAIKVARNETAEASTVQNPTTAQENAAENKEEGPKRKIVANEQTEFFHGTNSSEVICENGDSDEDSSTPNSSSHGGHSALPRPISQWHFCSIKRQLAF